MNWRRHWAYLKYVLKHKYYVWQEGRQRKLPMLLLLAHDLSKFYPSEWLPYARCFYAPDGSKQYDETAEFNVAWNHHQKRNKHHWQYWMITWDRGETECLVMPLKYLYEMWVDWKAASRAITGADNTQEWYLKNQNNIHFHPEVRWTIEKWLELSNEQQHPDSIAWYEGILDGSSNRTYTCWPTA